MVRMHHCNVIQIKDIAGVQINSEEKLKIQEQKEFLPVVSNLMRKIFKLYFTCLLSHDEKLSKL